MTTREADEVTVTDDERHQGKLNVSVRHGNYVTTLNVSEGELLRIHDAIGAHDALSDYRERRPRVTVTLTRLREVWAALGCAYNPNDFHISVQQTMWTQALNMIREATEQTSRVYRENQQLEEALLVARTSPSAPPAEDVREALTALDQAERFCAATKREPGQPTGDRVIADLMSALRRTVVVRPRGTVTDADEKDRLIAEYHDRAIRAEATAREALTRAQALANWRGTFTDAEPIDAQILAGLNAELPASKAAPSLDYYGSGNISRMRKILRAAAGVVSAGPATTAPAPAAPTDEDIPGGCVYCSSSGVIEDYEGDRPCSACGGTGTPPDPCITPAMKAEVLEEIAEAYVYVHAVSRTSSQVYRWLHSRAQALRARS